MSVSSKGANVDLIRVVAPVWLRRSGSVTDPSNGARDHYAQFSFGRHMVLGPQTILGLMRTLDTMSLTDPLG